MNKQINVWKCVKEQDVFTPPNPHILNANIVRTSWIAHVWETFVWDEDNEDVSEAKL